MPEGDALARAARRISVLVGEQLEVEAPNPRAAVKNIAPRLDGRRLESVEALGKNLFLRFEGGITLRSHLRMKGRWRVQPRGRETLGRPWLVLRGKRHEAVLWHGPVLELSDNVRRRLGADILAEPPDLDAMLRNLRALDPRTRVGEALVIQRAVAGIGNMWASEALFEARVSPWLVLSEAKDDELCGALEAAARLMRERLDGGRRRAHRVYRRKGRPCPRCGGTIRSWPLGDAARMAYWCPGCQRGEGPAAE